MVPLLAGPVLAATLNGIAAGPLPLPGDPSVIQPTFTAAVHEQFAAVVMTMLPDPPADPNDAADALTVYEQVTGTKAAWLMSTVWPATESVPVLPAPALAATLRVNWPFPVPLPPAVI
jgi:hypothetical protein